MNVEAERERLDGVAGWEMSIVILHPVIYAVTAAFALFKIGWPGLWWQLIGGIWSVTVAIGVVRSIRRRR